MIDNTEIAQHDGEDCAMQKLQEAGSAELPDKPCAAKKSYIYKADIKSREMHCLRSLWKTAHEFGFNIDGRITLRDLETGKVFD